MGSVSRDIKKMHNQDIIPYAVPKSKYNFMHFCDFSAFSIRNFLQVGKRLKKSGKNNKI